MNKVVALCESRICGASLMLNGRAHTNGPVIAIFLEVTRSLRVRLSCETLSVFQCKQSGARGRLQTPVRISRLTPQWLSSPGGSYWFTGLVNIQSASQCCSQNQSASSASAKIQKLEHKIASRTDILGVVDHKHAHRYSCKFGIAQCRTPTGCTSHESALFRRGGSGSLLLR